MCQAVIVPVNVKIWKAACFNTFLAISAHIPSRTFTDVIKPLIQALATMLTWLRCTVVCTRTAVCDSWCLLGITQTHSLTIDEHVTHATNKVIRGNVLTRMTQGALKVLDSTNEQRGGIKVQLPEGVDKRKVSKSVFSALLLSPHKNNISYCCEYCKYEVIWPYSWVVHLKFSMWSNVIVLHTR